MKKVLLTGALLVVLLSFVTVGMAGMSVKGTLTKIEGEFYTVQDEKGKSHKLHVDKKSTKIEGDVKEGAQVEVSATDKGHVEMIKAVK